MAVAEKNKKAKRFHSALLSSVRKKTKMFLRKRIQEKSCVIRHKTQDDVHSSVGMNSNTVRDASAKQDREEG